MYLLCVYVLERLQISLREKVETDRKKENETDNRGIKKQRNQFRLAQRQDKE